MKITLPLILATATALNITTEGSVCNTAKIIAKGAMNYYSDTPGEFTGVHWWISGSTIGSLLNYQRLCDDDSFENTIYESLISQSGSNDDYEPSWLYEEIGNDDVGAWALSVMEAAEMSFKEPENGPSWLERAQNAFDLLYGRWDNSTCDGGIRWQFRKDVSGYSYKATIANVNLMQLAARLAIETDDVKYTRAAESIFKWLTSAGLVNQLRWGTEVYDGFEVNECSDANKVLWTYNYGILIAATGYLFHLTGDSEWSESAENIIMGSQILFNNTVLYERACETYNTCNDDQKIFKGLYSRFIGKTKTLVPDLKERIDDLMGESAKSAARSCSGGTDGVTCGLNWSYDINGEYWDGKWSLGIQVSALETVLSIL